MSASHRGDFCPCTRLGPTDAILARSNYPDGCPASLLQLLAAESADIRAAAGARLSPPPPPAPAAQAVGSDSVGGGGGSTPGGCGSSSSSSAAWTGGGTFPEGHTATLVRRLAADAARVLNPAGDSELPQPALRPYTGGGGDASAGSGAGTGGGRLDVAERQLQADADTAGATAAAAESAAAAPQQRGDAAADPMAQRRDHEVPDQSQVGIDTSQVSIRFAEPRRGKIDIMRASPRPGWGSNALRQFGEATGLR